MNVEKQKRKMYDFNRREEGKFDVILKVEDLEFFVMKHHVGNYSPILFDKLCKSQEFDKNAIVELEGICAEPFQIFLELINGWNRLDDTNIESVVEALANLKARLPLRLCEEYLLDKSKLGEKIRFQLADKFGLKTLMSTLFSKIKSKYELSRLLPDDVTTLQKDTLVTILQKARHFLRRDEAVKQANSRRGPNEVRTEVRTRVSYVRHRSRACSRSFSPSPYRMQPGPPPAHPQGRIRDRSRAPTPPAPVQPDNIQRDLRRPQRSRSRTRSPSLSPSLSPSRGWQRVESPVHERSLSPPLPGFRRYFPRNRSPSPDFARRANAQRDRRPQRSRSRSQSRSPSRSPSPVERRRVEEINEQEESDGESDVIFVDSDEERDEEAEDNNNLLLNFWL